MPKSPESEILAKFLADMGEKFGEKMGKFFADFHPSISRKSGRKKFHEKLATNSVGRKTKFFHRETLGAWGRKSFGAMHGSECPFQFHIGIPENAETLLNKAAGNP